MEKSVVISAAVRDVLERAVVEGAADRPVVKLPPGQLDRALYVDVDKVLKALGGKWDRRAGGHVFSRPVDGELAEALESGRAVDIKRTREQFFTPPDLAAKVLAMAGDLEGEDVLEPSAGDGALAIPAWRAGAFVTAVEIGHLLACHLEGETEDRLIVEWADFMGWQPRPPETPAAFDAVIMNPPFSRGQDMAHVRRAFGFLKPGGRLVSIMSPHWTFASDRQSVEFREFVRALDHSWALNPEGSFKQSGTGVTTGILCIHKEQ